MKTCSKCEIEKSLEYFYNQETCKDGKTGHCKECTIARTRARYKANKKHCAARDKVYYEANKEHIFEVKKVYCENNKEKIRAKNKIYYAVNKEHVAVTNKAYYEANKDHLAAKKKTFYENNPDKRRAINSRRRAVKLQRSPVWADRTKVNLFYVNRPECMSIDHVLPLKGRLISGLHVHQNLQYLSPSENSVKHNKISPELFARVESEMMDWICRNI